MASGSALGGWQQGFSESQNVSGGGCSECSSGRLCDCAKICQSKCKKKFKEKLQCAYAVGFAVCLVFVLFVWMMWPMIGSTVNSFKNKFATPGAAAPVSTSGAGVYAPNPPPQYMPCRSWLDQGLPLTQTSGYLNGVYNEPGATNGRQMGSKYQMDIDHPGSYDAGGSSGSQIVQAEPSAPAAPKPDDKPAAPVASKFYGRLDGGPFAVPDAHHAAPSPAYSKFDGSRLGGFQNHDGSRLGGFQSHDGGRLGGFQSHDGGRLGFKNYPSGSFDSKASGFIGGTSAQYPSEWATPGRDEDVTEMTLRCATQHQYGDVPTHMPAAAPAAAAASAAAAAKPAGFTGIWPFNQF